MGIAARLRWRAGGPRPVGLCGVRPWVEGLRFWTDILPPCCPALRFVCPCEWGRCWSASPVRPVTPGKPGASGTLASSSIRWTPWNGLGANWWAGHRNGASGLMNPSTADISNFKAARDWTYDRIQEGDHFCDDVRFWAMVQAIVIR